MLFYIIMICIIIIILRIRDIRNNLHGSVLVRHYADALVTGEKPPDKSPPVKSYVSLGFRPRAFHRGDTIQRAFHLEPMYRWQMRGVTQFLAWHLAEN